MPVKITTATSSSDIDAVLQLRHGVFVEEGGYMAPHPDRRLIDRFDAYPTTTNFVAKADGRLVGAIRLTLDSPMGVPADEYFDFRPLVPSDAKVLGTGMFCVDKPFRSGRMALGMILMASYYGVSHGVTHVIAPVNPPIARLVLKVGFKPVCEVVTDPHSGLDILPVLLDVADLNDTFLRFIRRHEQQNFLSAYECLFVQPGETIIRAGEAGSTAYVVIEGEVEITYPGSDEVIAVLGEGEMFGELALLTDEIRTANVVARGDVKLMTLEKAVFLQHVMANPNRALALLKGLGQRQKLLINKLL